MTNEIQIYQLDGVRVLPEGASFSVVLSDLAKHWNYPSSTHLARLLDDSELSLHVVETQRGQRRKTKCVNEKGLNRLVSTLRRPELKAWQDRLYGEIIPQWNRTGMAVDVDRVDLSDPGTVLELASRAGELAKEYRARAEVAESKVAELSPKAEAHDDLMSAEGAYPMDTTAQMLKTGRNRLYALLRDKGILRKFASEPFGSEIHSGHLPYQQFIDRGYFETKADRYRDHYTGVTKVSHKVYVTPRGVDWLRSKI